MKKITSLHGRANVILRADLHNRVHGFMERDGEIDTDVFGKVRVAAPIQYKTPVPRNSFAFGQIGCMGLPAREGTGRIRPPCVEEGSIVGFDLYQTGHQIDASQYYEQADSFVTLPWKEIICVFVPGQDLPIPVGNWCMLRVDEIATRRLVFSSAHAGGKIVLPGSVSDGVATNKGNAGQKTKVRLVAGQFWRMGPTALQHADGIARPGKTHWALVSPMDAVTLRYNKKRVLTFAKWDDLEQVIEDDAG